MSDVYKTLHPIKYYRDYLSHEIRPDSRKSKQSRPVIVNLDSISPADGSSLVRIGSTTVVCGIKAELCVPKAEKPNEGFLIPNLELPPLCSARFKPGPPAEQAQVYTQLVDDIWKSSGCLDLKSLCIFSDKLAWCLYADLVCLDFDGSVIDACIIALIAALKTVTLPEISYDPALDNKQVSLDKRAPLNITCIPISTTFATIDDQILMDPTVEEEDLSTSLITVVLKDKEICFLHKPGGSAISDEDMYDCIEQSKSRSALIHDTITTALKNKGK